MWIVTHIIVIIKTLIIAALSPKSQIYDLPLKDFPQSGILDPLDVVNFTQGHGTLKQHLNPTILRCRFGERYELKDKSTVQINEVFKYIVDAQEG